jgi:TatD DNase family protein
MIDSHCHLDGEEFAEDLRAVIQRAQEAGVTKVLVPAIDQKSCHSVLQLCEDYPNFCFPMFGLHPEEVRPDWQEVLSTLRSTFFPEPSPSAHPKSQLSSVNSQLSIINSPIAIGEVGLDFYWSREFEQEQLLAFEEQVRWSVDLQLPLMIHCRKAQNELVAILKKYKTQLPGGVFHCFTGNEIEARELLQFDNFVLGIGGVLTFKKSPLPEVLPKVVPLDRIILETDAPYMAPVPHRGQRNEPAFVREVLLKLAEAYQLPPEEVDRITSQNVERIFDSISQL